MYSEAESNSKLVFSHSKKLPAAKSRRIKGPSVRLPPTDE